MKRKLLWAMASELPCVVTRVGALDELVMDGETGLVVRPDDTDALARALLSLLEDRSPPAFVIVDHQLDWLFPAMVSHEETSGVIDVLSP